MNVVGHETGSKKTQPDNNHTATSGNPYGRIHIEIHPIARSRTGCYTWTRGTTTRPVLDIVFAGGAPPGISLARKEKAELKMSSIKTRGKDELSLRHRN